jgi:hypothetical protein
MGPGVASTGSRIGATITLSITLSTSRRPRDT